MADGKRVKYDSVLLAHGTGGKLMHDLVSDLFRAKFSNPLLDKLDDMATFDASGCLAFTTDSYVVNPLFFSGGDIGKLAVCGTVNDLAMSGAVPKYLSCAFVIEEGLPMADLERILDSMVAAAKEAGVLIVTGDTKVVERGGADKIFVNTAGVGFVPDSTAISGSNVAVGDKIILSGTIGDHGITIMSQREGLGFETTLASDCAPLGGMVADMLAASSDIHALRDPTRGGLSSTLNEFAEASGVCVRIKETAVPIKEEVLGACEMLGYDPFHVANEGKLVAAVAPEAADAVLAAVRGNKYGADAAIIGEVTAEPPGKVIVETTIGAHRILDMLVGEQLPRIC